MRLSLGLRKKKALPSYATGHFRYVAAYACHLFDQACNQR